MILIDIIQTRDGLGYRADILTSEYDGEYLPYKQVRCAVPGGPWDMPEQAIFAAGLFFATTVPVVRETSSVSSEDREAVIAELAALNDRLPADRYPGPR